MLRGRERGPLTVGQPGLRLSLGKQLKRHLLYLLAYNAPALYEEIWHKKLPMPGELS